RYPIGYIEGGIAVAPQEAARVEKAWTDKGQAVVDRVRDSAQADGVKAKAVIARSGQIAEAIIAAGKKHKCDLIVMASHGRRGLKGILLGSETQHVLTHSDTPVLVLR